MSSRSLIVASLFRNELRYRSDSAKGKFSVAWLDGVGNEPYQFVLDTAFADFDKMHETYQGFVEVWKLLSQASIELLDTM
jgi:hypothetical protein